MKHFMYMEARHPSDPVLDFATSRHVPACDASVITGVMTANREDVDCPLCQAWIEGNLDEACRIQRFVEAQCRLDQAMVEVSKAHSALTQEIFKEPGHDPWYENRKLVCDFFRKYMDGQVVILQREVGVKKHGTP